jgi:hypothetical protein
MRNINSKRDILRIFKIFSRCPSFLIYMSYDLKQSLPRGQKKSTTTGNEKKLYK